MLSMSADLTNTDVNLQMINGDESATTGGVQYARELMKFAEAVATRDSEALITARSALHEAAGDEVVITTLRNGEQQEYTLQLAEPQ